MTARPKPPEAFDENPPLDADFFARARPAAPGEAACPRSVLEPIVQAHEERTPASGRDRQCARNAGGGGIKTEG